MKLYISFFILITVTSILQVIVKNLTENYQISREVPSNIKYWVNKFPKRREREREANTWPHNLFLKKIKIKRYIVPYIATTNLTYVCNIFATKKKNHLLGNYSNLLHLDIKMTKRCNNIILPPASSYLLFQLWEEDIGKNIIRQQRSLEQFHTLSINHIKKYEVTSLSHKHNWYIIIT